jgi:hypothetical protein
MHKAHSNQKGSDNAQLRWLSEPQVLEGAGTLTKVSHKPHGPAGYSFVGKQRFVALAATRPHDLHRNLGLQTSFL